MTPPLAAAATPPPARNGRASVLVCDDTAAKRYVISSWLRRDGYTVLEAETGAEALAVTARETVDLAVLDVHLPDMNGLDVCARIKADPHTASMPVLHISAVAVETADRSAGLDRGADAYLVDPIQPQEMLSTVRSLLRSSSARRNAERLAERLDRLSAATLRVNVAVNPMRVATAASEGATRMFGCPAAVVLMDDSAAGVLCQTDQRGMTHTEGLGSDSTEALLGRLSEPTIVHASEAPWSDVLPDDGDGSWAVQPIRGTAGLAGMIAVPARTQVSDDDQMLLRRMAGTASVALANLRVFVEEHRTALTLQRSLLPASLPPLPGLVVAARYKASGEQVEIGGDFFDAFTLDDRRTVVVIGDVEGHSLEAAVVMAELRYSLRAYLYDGHTATEVLALLNRLLQRGHPELTATMCLLVFSEDRRTVEVANAGHLPPLLLRDGRATYLQPSGTLLGLDGHTAQPVVLPVEPGHRILLMTDGLVERRGKGIEVALGRIADQAARSALSAEDLCDRLMETWGGGGEDDVCLLVLDVLTSPAASPAVVHPPEVGDAG